MRYQMFRVGAIALLSVAAAVSGMQVASAQTASLNQQLTIHLNSGSRSTTRDQADRLVGEGKTQAAMGDLQTAIASWRQAIRLYEQTGDLDAQSTVYGYLAQAYQQLDNPRAQEDVQRRQLAATRDQRDFTGQIYANNALACTLAPRQNGTPAAGELLTEGMEVAASVRNARGEYQTAQNMNWLANSLDQADFNVRRYEVVFMPPSQWYANPISYGTKLNQRGVQNMAAQRYYMATRLNGVANSLATQAGVRSLHFQAIDDQVMAYRAMGRYDLATDSLEERLQLAKTLKEPGEEMFTLALLGELNQDVGRTFLAQRFYEQALTVAERLNDSEQTGLLKERLASFQAK